MSSCPQTRPNRRHFAVFLCLFAAAFGFTFLVRAEAQAPSASHPQPIDNGTILKMANAGLGDDILVQTIELQPGSYDTSPDALIALKQGGLSDRVISTLQAHGTGLAVRANRAGALELPPPPPAPPPAGV